MVFYMEKYVSRIFQAILLFPLHIIDHSEAVSAQHYPTQSGRGFKDWGGFGDE